ncbi:hypothetical protein FEM48_Zijuj05G0094000 [Ziziphus jujuba var. spinosa]|uniref:Uncharacterized protein n=1 Tax=Ziziphus jujuba var. spinosa TaxID=714518 RepID=A0A978VE55_ZIZJJ|nr:hypothetical protein FEM48_Zijuj05G0094000 [Ziziphus jujuba var. spinosa]
MTLMVEKMTTLFQNLDQLLRFIDNSLQDTIMKIQETRAPCFSSLTPVYKKVSVLLRNSKSFPERALARFWTKLSDKKVVFGVFGTCRAEGEQQ